MHGTRKFPTYYANTGDNLPYDKRCPMGVELQTYAKTENHARYDNPPFTANHVSHWEREKRPKEGPSRENGYLSSKSKSLDKKSWGRLRCTNDKTFAVDWKKMVASSNTCWQIWLKRPKCHQPIFHGNNSCNRSRIIPIPKEYDSDIVGG